VVPLPSGQLAAAYVTKPDGPRCGGRSLQVGLLANARELRRICAGWPKRHTSNRPACRRCLQEPAKP